MKNYYDILEVNPKASKEVIEKAYKVLIKKYHPDLYTGAEKVYAENQTKDINEAYRILSDDFLRAQYEEELKKEIERQNNQRYNNQNQDGQEQPNYWDKRNQKRNERKNQKKEAKSNKNDVGTLMGIIGVVKEIFKAKPKGVDRRKIDKKDIIALISAIVITLIVLVIMWFIPATQSFVKGILFMD